jgi:hypothetical protein
VFGGIGITPGDAKGIVSVLLPAMAQRVARGRRLMETVQSYGVKRTW